MDLQRLFFRGDDSDESSLEAVLPDRPRDRLHGGVAGVPIDLDVNMWTALIAEPYGIGWGGNAAVEESV